MDAMLFVSSLVASLIHCLRLSSIVSHFSCITTIFLILVLTNLVAIFSFYSDAILGSITRAIVIDGVSLSVFLLCMIGLVLFEFSSNVNLDYNVILSSTSPTVEGVNICSYLYSHSEEDIQNAKRESLLTELQMIWDEIGESRANKEKTILELEREECLEVYKRKIDEASRIKYHLLQKIKKAIAQQASLSSKMGNSELYADQLDEYPKNLEEELMMVPTRLECMQRKICKRWPIETPVILNIYDLTSANRFFSWAGLGAYHSGVEVYGVEYSFGAADGPSCGMFKVEPKKCPSCTFKKSIVVGTTSYSPFDVSLFMEGISRNYKGDSYNLLTKNCNHFSKDVCLKLTGKSIPKWVNRLAKLGSQCCCISK